MDRQTCLQFIRQGGVVAILRAKTDQLLLKASEAICSAGVMAIEVTMNTPGALRLIEQAVAHFADQVAFGAGTVLNADDAHAALDAGAQFIVAPTLKAEVIELCRQRNVPVLPGVYTPTEILTAWELGADMVKVFPASVGGPGFIKAVRAPLPQIEIIPVGGVTLENAAAYIRAGAAAIGVGSELLVPTLLQAQDWHAITQRTRQLIAAIAQARGQS